MDGFGIAAAKKISKERCLWIMGLSACAAVLGLGGSSLDFGSSELKTRSKRRSPPRCF